MEFEITRKRLTSGVIFAVAVTLLSASCASAQPAPPQVTSQQGTQNNAVQAQAVSAKRWIPAPGTTWQWQLDGKSIDLSVPAKVYDVDYQTTSAKTVQKLHSQKRKVVCYVSVGSWENYRPDKGAFPAKVIGKPLDGWPGEKWLDIRQVNVLKSIMAKRFDICKSKGFDAVEPDNVDGYANRSGFPLTGAQQLAYNKMIAKLAHDRGMSVALKNDNGQIPQLVNYFDFAVIEECFAYNECSTTLPFIKKGKAVFEAEYSAYSSTICNKAKQMRISTIFKKLSLDSYRKACP